MLSAEMNGGQEAGAADCKVSQLETPRGLRGLRVSLQALRATTASERTVQPAFHESE